MYERRFLRVCGGGGGWWGSFGKSVVWWGRMAARVDHWSALLVISLFLGDLLLDPCIHVCVHVCICTYQLVWSVHVCA